MERISIRKVENAMCLRVELSGGVTVSYLSERDVSVEAVEEILRWLRSLPLGSNCAVDIQVNNLRSDVRLRFSLPSGAFSEAFFCSYAGWERLKGQVEEKVGEILDDCPRLVAFTCSLVTDFLNSSAILGALRALGGQVDGRWQVKQLLSFVEGEEKDRRHSILWRVEGGGVDLDIRFFSREQPIKQGVVLDTLWGVLDLATKVRQVVEGKLVPNVALTGAFWDYDYTLSTLTLRVSGDREEIEQEVKFANGAWQDANALEEKLGAALRDFIHLVEVTEACAPALLGKDGEGNRR